VEGERLYVQQDTERGLLAGGMVDSSVGDFRSGDWRGYTCFVGGIYTAGKSSSIRIVNNNVQY